MQSQILNSDAFCRSIVLSMKEMFNVCILMIIIIGIFAILGVQLFSGKFYSCNDRLASGIIDCVGAFFLASCV